MATIGAWHSMFIELHGGMLTLAALCILAVIVNSLYGRLRGTNNLPGSSSSGRLGSFLGSLARYAEPTAYLAGIGGVGGLILSAIVGFYVWPLDTLMNSALGLTKVMFSIFATELWIAFVLIRAKFGPTLWKNSRLAGVSVCVGFAGYFFMVLTGSFGAHMAGIGSILDPVYALLGVNPEAFWVIGFSMIPILIIVSFVEIVTLFAVFMYLRGRAKL